MNKRVTDLTKRKIRLMSKQGDEMKLGKRRLECVNVFVNKTMDLNTLGFRTRLAG